MAIRSLAMHSIAPVVRPILCPGRYCAPAGALQPHGLLGDGLPRPLRGLAMTDLGVRCVWRECPSPGKRVTEESQLPCGGKESSHEARPQWAGPLPWAKYPLHFSPKSDRIDQKPN